MPNEYPELENCPFCGSGDIAPEVNHDRDHAQARCGECGACGPMADQIGGYTQPAIAWNTRTAPKVSDKMVEAASMALLGHEERGDLAPGVDWRVDRAWTIGIVREQIKKALTAALER